MQLSLAEACFYDKEKSKGSIEENAAPAGMDRMWFVSVF